MTNTYQKLTIFFRSSVKITAWLKHNYIQSLFVVLTFISIASFIHYYQNELGLAYNDARSHLDIARRVVEGLKPGIAQLGSVWLPLPHVLMLPTIWNDFMWHSGLAGALPSMISFVGTGIVIALYLKRLGVSMVWQLFGVFIFVANINILYLQSTAMTELILLFTMTLASYHFLKWYQEDNMLELIKCSFWVMLATLVRYDGWFLLFFSLVLVIAKVLRFNTYKKTEGLVILFCSMGGLGIALWLLWNLLIFGDPLYFAFGPFSAHAQQEQLDAAGVLATKKDWLLSFKLYSYALVYNSGAFMVVLSVFGALALWFNRKLTETTRVATSLLLAPLIFNVLALYLGHSVLFVQGISGDTWFNVRYGIMLAPTIAIFTAYLLSLAKKIRIVLLGSIVFILFFTFTSYDAVTIDDARVGSSQKNVSEVSGYLTKHATNTPGFILISVASHDAIIFSSGLPMKRFIHEGSGVYWDVATVLPDKWARWIVMRTNDDNDLTWRNIKDKPGLAFYNLVAEFPFASVYELKPEYLKDLNTEANLINTK